MAAKTVPGSTTLGKVIKARICGAGENRPESLKLLVVMDNGLTEEIYDAFRTDRKVNDKPYVDFLMEAFGVASKDKLGDAIIASPDKFVCKQVVYPLLATGADGKPTAVVDEDGQPVMADARWRVELVF